MYSEGERLLLLQAMVVRRVPEKSRVESSLLMEALQADHELVRQNTPHLYFNDWHTFVGMEVDNCVEQELLDDGIRIVKGVRRGPAISSYTRTDLGNLFLKTLEPRLADALEEMPMSDVGMLDFLGLL